METPKHFVDALPTVIHCDTLILRCSSTAQNAVLYHDMQLQTYPSVCFYLISLASFVAPALSSRDPARTSSKDTSRTGRSGERRMHIRRHAHPDLPYPFQKTLERQSCLSVDISTQQVHAKRVKRLNVLLKVTGWKVHVCFHDVDDYWSPCHNIALLCLLIERSETANDVCAKSIQS